MVTLKTSPEANYHGHHMDKATYRGTSYRSAQKCPKLNKVSPKMAKIIYIWSKWRQVQEEA